MRATTRPMMIYSLRLDIILLFSTTDSYNKHAELLCPNSDMPHLNECPKLYFD